MRASDILDQIDEAREILEHWDESIEIPIISDDEGFIPEWPVAESAPSGTYIMLKPDAESARKLHEHYKQAGFDSMVRPEDLHMTLLETPRSREPQETDVGYTIEPHQLRLRVHTRLNRVFLEVNNPLIHNRRNTWMKRLNITQDLAKGKPHITIARHRMRTDPDGNMILPGRLPPPVDFPIRLVKEHVMRSNRV